MSERPTQELLIHLKEQRVVPVIGAGVSRQVANLPGWRALIESAVSHARERLASEPIQAVAIKRLLNANRFVPAAQKVQEMLGAPNGEFPAWLKRQFAIPEKDRKTSILHKIADLQCLLTATTNYDTLLQDCDFEPRRVVTWQDGPAMQRGLRDQPTILHLHGVYDRPDSIVFGVSDYSVVAQSAGYRAVLSSLWLTKSLLFIGCSWDGIQDPDFSKLFKWASQTFPGSPYYHYAVMRKGELDAKQVKALLFEHRVQVIEYGDSFEALGPFLAKLNPNESRAFSRRVMRIRELSSGIAEEDRATEVEELLRGLSASSASTAQIRAAAANILSRRKKTHAALAAELAEAKKRARLFEFRLGVANSEYAKWRRGKIVDFTGAFRTQVLRAAALLGTCTSDLLHELRLRGVYIHEYWLSGYLQGFLEDLQKASAFKANDYWLENASRILSSATALLEASPAEIFREEPEGTPLTAQRTHYLVIAIESEIQLRAIDKTESCAAALRIAGPRLRRAHIIKDENRTVILGYTLERCFWWDPRSSGHPFAEFRPSEGYSNVYTVKPCWSATDQDVLVESEGSYCEVLRNRKLQSTIHPIGRHSISYYIRNAYNPSQFFGVERDEIVLITESGTFDVLYGSQGLRDYLLSLPELKKYLKAQLRREFQILGREGRRSHCLLSHVWLQTAVVGSRHKLICRAQICWTRGGWDSVILLIDMETRAFEGCAFLEGLLALTFTTTAVPMRGERILVGTLRNSLGTSVFEINLSGTGVHSLPVTPLAGDGRYDVSALTTDGSMCFYGTEEGSVYRIDLVSRSSHRVTHIEGVEIRSLGLSEF